MINMCSIKNISGIIIKIIENISSITLELDAFVLLGVRFSKHQETIADDHYVNILTLSQNTWLRKWETTLNWTIRLKITFKYRKDSKQQWLQKRINNIILGTKHLLQKWV